MNDTYRDKWLEALDRLLPFAEELKTRTEAAYGATEPATLVRSVILIGVRGRRLMQGARLLAERKWDDLVANLARALVDAAIEVDYMTITSNYGKSTKRRTLTPEDKARLFETQRFLLLDMKTGELTAEQREHQSLARQLREDLGVRIGHTWHGRTTRELLDDLMNIADEEAKKGVEGLAQAFRLSSFFEHSNANPNFYTERRSKTDFVVLDTVTHSWPIQITAQAGGGVLNRWGEVLGFTEQDRIERLGPVLRMKEVDPMSFPADS